MANLPFGKVISKFESFFDKQFVAFQEKAIVGIGIGPFGKLESNWQTFYEQGSISSTFYVRVFLYKSAWRSFSFGKKALSYEKHTHKMLMKLTPGVNFINILLPAFAPIILSQKITKAKL